MVKRRHLPPLRSSFEEEDLLIFELAKLPGLTVDQGGRHLTQGANNDKLQGGTQSGIAQVFKN